MPVLDYHDNIATMLSESLLQGRLYGTIMYCTLYHWFIPQLCIFMCNAHALGMNGFV